jgi:ABC-type histidine transport system ATPase subunit
MRGFFDFDLIEGIFVFVAGKRYNSSSATQHVCHGLVEVTFTLNGHDGDVICISGSDGGGKGRFSYVEIDVPNTPTPTQRMKKRRG